MRLRSKRFLLLAALAAVCFGLNFGSARRAWPQTTGATPAASTPAQNAPGAATKAAAEDDTPYTIRTRVEEVLLHATVLEKDRIVNNLGKDNFFVYEDNVAQPITSFRHDDIPVSMGIVIDNSGSMREKRPSVNTAALNLVRSSNPQDEVFVVNFNDERYLDQDFTNKISLLKEAMEKIDSRGGTALYDALEGAAEHLKLHARLDKKVILVVTDGEDNASRESLEQTVRYMQQDNGPQVFAIGLLQDDREGKRAKRALSLLAEHTGGQAFFPKDVSEVDAITQQVAHDIRNQYTIGYKPSHAKSAGGYRQVRLEARAKGMSKLVVRTRTGYYANDEKAEEK